MRLTRTLICIWMFCSLYVAPGPFSSPGRCQDRTSHREKATYTFTYLGFPVAQGSIIISDSTDTDNRTVKVLEALASSSSPTSFLFKIDNRYITTVDPETGFPLTYEKSIIQSNMEEHTLHRFDQERGIIYRDDRQVASHSSPVHTFLSALDHIINHSFEARQVLELPVYAAGRVWNVKVEAIRVDKIRTPMGSVPSVLVEIQFCPASSGDTVKMKTDVLTNRLTSGGENTRLWISLGNQPVLVKAEYTLYPSSLHMNLSGKGQ